MWHGQLGRYAQQRDLSETPLHKELRCHPEKFWSLKAVAPPP